MTPKEPARNAEYLKIMNRRHILRLLRRAPMSRIELAAGTGLPRAAITMITREMIDEGLLSEGEASVRPGKGKHPIPLTINPAAFIAAGVALTRSGCTVGIADLSGKLLARRTLQVSPPDGLVTIRDALRELIVETGTSPLGIGISAPGPLDAARGTILNPPYFEAWHNTAAAPYLASSLNLPAYLEKDASALALWHLDRGCSRDFLLLLVDSGIGSGIVSDGRLFTSSGRFTSELGHITIRFDGKKCGCGNLGCLEAYASIPNLLADAGCAHRAWREVIDADDTALIDREAEYLAAGITTIRNLVNIDTVYLAGDIRYGFDRLAPRLMHRVSAQSMLKSPINILPAGEIADIGVAAAANLVFSAHLSAE